MTKLIVGHVQQDFISSRCHNLVQQKRHGPIEVGQPLPKRNSTIRSILHSRLLRRDWEPRLPAWMNDQSYRFRISTARRQSHDSGHWRLQKFKTHGRCLSPSHDNLDIRCGETTGIDVEFYLSTEYTQKPLQPTRRRNWHYFTNKRSLPRCTPARSANLTCFIPSNARIVLSPSTIKASRYAAL